MSPSQSIRDKKWWTALRKKVHARDGGKCRLCGDSYGPGKMIVAHILSRAKYPELQKLPENCLLLCFICDARYGDNLSGKLKKKRR